MNRGFLLLLAAVVAVALAVGAILAALTAPPAPAAQSTGGSRTTAAADQPGAGAAGPPQGVRTSGPSDTTAQGAPGGGTQGLRTTGTISSVDGDTVTMSTPQGDVKVKAAEARIQKTVEGTVADLTTGQRITVQGQRGEDGSLSATAIQIVPEGERGPQQGGEQGCESGRGPMVEPTTAAQ